MAKKRSKKVARRKRTPRPKIPPNKAARLLVMRHVEALLTSLDAARTDMKRIEYSAAAEVFDDTFEAFSDEVALKLGLGVDIDLFLASKSFD